MADASNISKLSEQILGQGISDKWQGQGFGSAKANAEDMAKILAGIGITDINQFGEIDVPADVAVTPVYDYRMEDRGGEEGTVRVPYVVGYTGPDGKSVDQSLVKAADVWQGGGDSGNYETVYSAPIGTAKAYGNKETGTAVPNTYGERQNENAWGGTYAGKGNTGYRVQFVEGKPIFYTTEQSSNTLVGMIGDNKLLAIAANIGAAYFGGPAGVAALQAAQGKDIGDIVKAAALTYVGGQVSNAVSGSASVIDTLGKAGANIAGKAAGAIATGRDPINAAISGGLGTMAGESAGLTGDVASTVGTSVVSGIAASFRGQDATDAMITGAVTGYLSNTKTTNKTGYDATEFEGSLAKETTDYNIDDGLDTGFDATEFEGSLTKKTDDGNFLSTVGDAASKVFTGMSGAAAVKAGVLTGLATTTNKSNDLTISGGLGGRTTTTDTSAMNLSQDDLYKDAPIKGYHMKQNAEGRYIPYIGDRALLAKGGFVSKRN
jgi:hypothetical protein